MAIANPLASGWGHIFKDRHELEEARDKFEYYHRLARERQAAAAQAAGVGVSIQDVYRQNILEGLGAQAQKAQPAPKIDLNTNPAYACDLTAAMDLWCAKYGTMWVSLEAVEDAASEEYALYKVLAERLRNAHRMEYMAELKSYRIIL